MPRFTSSSSSTLLAFVALAPLVALSGACVSVQDFGGDAPDAAPPPGEDPGPPDGSIGDESPAPVGTWQWNWIDPTPTGRSLYGIGGTSATDVWVAGEGGTVSHWNGTTWDVRHTGGDGVRYFAVGVQKKNDVWVAGNTADGKIDVVHYDGTDWKESYPFAGSAFGGFSHGPGARLFAFVDWDIQELTAAGTWKSTDTSANDVFGPPADVYVSASGEAWAITIGTKIMHLPAGSTTWELIAPAGVPSNSAGLSISGAGSKLCAFYTGRAAGGAGYLTYDGAWHVNPTATDPLTLDSTPHGALSACFDDGSGLLVYGGGIVTASTTEAPGLHLPFDFQGEKLFGAWSPDGTKAYTVGTLGAFVARTAGQIDGAEVGPTIRKDVLALDVGGDGAVMLANASQPDRSSGGDVLFYKDSVLKPGSGTGFGAPSIPVGVAVVAQDDAWVLANDNSMAGVAHWKNGWGVTRFLGGALTSDGLAIFAPAKDDVWITASQHCPDLDPLPGGACSTKLAPYAWHYDGKAWNAIDVPSVYRSIHGSGPNDVWFAGDGVAHWDGTSLTTVPIKGAFAGVWSSTKGHVWLWGERAILWDGATETPVEKALGASAEWTTTGIAEAAAGDVFVLTKRGTGTSLLWFDSSHTKLVEQISSDLELWGIRGRGNELWAFGAGGASLRFSPPIVH
jgi:hypothetical protein